MSFYHKEQFYVASCWSWNRCARIRTVLVAFWDSQLEVHTIYLYWAFGSTARGAQCEQQGCFLQWECLSFEINNWRKMWRTLLFRIETQVFSVKCSNITYSLFPGPFCFETFARFPLLFVFVRTCYDPCVQITGFIRNWAFLSRHEKLQLLHWWVPRHVKSGTSEISRHFFYVTFSSWHMKLWNIIR